MSEIFGFIGKYMDTTTKALRSVNNKFSTVAVLFTVYMVVQDQKIKKLAEELEELKHKGE